VLRFGPDESDSAEQLFEELEFFEHLNPEFRKHLDPESAFSAAYEGHLSHRPPTPLPPAPARLDDPVSRAIPRATWVATAILTTAMLAVLAVLVVEQPFASGGDSQVVGSGRPPQQEGSGLKGTLTPGSSETNQEDAAEPPTLPGVQVYANQAGGYLFSYPGSWIVDEQGTEAHLTSPDGTVRVVFGLVPGGSLSRASDVLVERVMRSQGGVEITTSSRHSTEQGLRALLVGGTVQNDGLDGRFLAISVQGFDETKAITVYFPKGRGVLDTLADVREVISSYRVSAPS
jgi:hypothetical protein